MDSYREKIANFNYERGLGMYINPYENAEIGVSKGLKANFHTHAGTGKGTCGRNEIDDVLAAYKDAGYDLLTISNHDIFSDVADYQEKHDIILINGYEYSAEPHMLCIGGSTTSTGNHQEAVDACLNQGGFVILCHPNWIRKEYWPWKDIDALKGFTGIEIYNHLIFTMSGSGLATDTWDHILSGGRLAWGFGSDDFHRWHDMGRAWNIIFSPSKSHIDIKSSIANGSFCVSTGLVLNEIKFDGNKLLVHAQFVDSYIKDFEYRFIGYNGALLDVQTGEKATYDFKGNEKYVRVEVRGENGSMLWTQPIYKKDAFQKP